MKSVFFIAIFLIIAGAMSQPEKSVAEFSSLEVTVPASFKQNKINQITTINLSSLVGERSYKVNFTGLASDLRGLYNSTSNYRFSFEDCKLIKKPNFSLNCSEESSKESKNKVQLTSFRLTPVFMLGKEKSPYYIVDIVFIDKEGEDISLKYFTTPESLHLSKLSNGVKVTQK